MPKTNKKVTKKVAKSKSQNIKKEITSEFHKLGDKITALTNKAKAKYDQSDAQTKKKIIVGVAGAAAILSGIVGFTTLKNRKKK